MEKPVFAVDVDGVLLDLTPGIKTALSNIYDAYIDEEDITTWDWSYALSISEGLTTDLWRIVWSTPSTVYPGANDFIRELKQLGFKVVAVSTRPEVWPELGSMARNAAKRDFPLLELDEVRFVNNHSDKGRVLRDIKARYFIEDNPKNAAQAKEEGGVDISFLIDKPWNRQCTWVRPAGAWLRVFELSEAVTYITLPEKE